MKLAIVAANNHYAGFGPGTVNIFRNMIGLPVAKWEEKKMGIQKQEDNYPTHDSRQRTLSEFMS
jgi:Na+/glutamate symporter